MLAVAFIVLRNALSIGSLFGAMLKGRFVLSKQCVYCDDHVIFIVLSGCVVLQSMVCIW